MRRNAGFFLALALSLGSLAAQQSSLSGPVEGFTFDLPSQSFRCVIGLPGSAFLGAAVVSGFDTGWVAPRKNYAIAFQQGNGFLVTGLDSDQVSSTPLMDLSGAPDAIVWSADGSAAVLYSRAGNWLQVLRGLPDAPQAASVVDLSPLGGSLAAVASDAPGKNVALAMQGDNGGAFLLTGAQSLAPLLPMTNPTGLAFSQDGASLYVLDGGASQLRVITLSDSSSQAFALDGLQNPTSIAPGRDAQGRPLVFVAGQSDQILRVYDPTAQQALVDLPLSFQPTGITVLGRNSFVLASRSQSTDPLWLFASVPQPAVYFVPAVSSSNSGGID